MAEDRGQWIIRAEGNSARLGVVWCGYVLWMDSLTYPSGNEMIMFDMQMSFCARVGLRTC